MITATPKRREALAPSLVMEGAMKPMMISGTQKLMSWPMMYCSVTTTFMTLSEKTAPHATPTKIPRINRNGRLPKSFFIQTLPLSNTHGCAPGGARSPSPFPSFRFPGGTGHTGAFSYHTPGGRWSQRSFRQGNPAGGMGSGQQVVFNGG